MKNIQVLFRLVNTENLLTGDKTLETIADVTVGDVAVGHVYPQCGYVPLAALVNRSLCTVPWEPSAEVVGHIAAICELLTP